MCRVLTSFSSWLNSGLFARASFRSGSGSPESSGPGAGIGEVTRFNEGIDQALAESVESNSRDLATSRDMFVGVLGNDLRSPLSAIMASNAVLKELDVPQPERVKVAERSARAARDMSRLISLMATQIPPPMATSNSPTLTVLR